MKTTEEILEMVFDYGDSRQHEPADKWSVMRIKSAIEELVAERDELRDELRVEKINTECYLTGAKKIHDELIAKLAAYKPVAYMAYIDGKPCWDADDIVCVDAVWPAGPDDDRVSVPIYARDDLA